MPTRQRGTVYKVKGGYGVRWTEADGNKRRHAPSPPFPTKTAARTWFAEHVLPRLNGGTLAADPRMTLRQFSDRYLRMHAATHEPVTNQTLRYRVEHYALPQFGDVPLVELERMPLAIGEWRETLPRRSAYGIVQALRQLLNAAVSYDLIRVNPAVKAGRNPQPKAEEIQPFGPDELDALAEELGPTYGPLVMFVAEAGLRPSEWIALERRDVLAGVVLVERSVTAGRMKAYGKTNGSRRRVPLSSRATVALEGLPPRIDTRLLFPAPEGGYLDLQNWRTREWYPALDAAGLSRRGPYALRHTFATNALAAGLGTFELARYMGTSVEMIERTYGHLAQGSEDYARARLDAYASRMDHERTTKEAADAPE